MLETLLLGILIVVLGGLALLAVTKGWIHGKCWTVSKVKQYKSEARRKRQERHIETERELNRPVQMNTCENMHKGCVPKSRKQDIAFCYPYDDEAPAGGSSQILSLGSCAVCRQFIRHPRKQAGYQETL